MRRVTLLLVAAGLAGCPGLGQVAFDVDSQGQSTVPGNPAGGLLSGFPSFGNCARCGRERAQVDCAPRCPKGAERR